jgi:hypothetical protein
MNLDLTPNYIISCIYNYEYFDMYDIFGLFYAILYELRIWIC